MADWGPFVQGLAHTLPQVGFQTYGLRQRDEALARQEKQLQHQIKMGEINQAQENFFKGVQLLPTLSDDVAPALVKTFIAPAIGTLNKHGVTGYSPEETQSFLDQLQQNPTAAKAVAKDINALIKNPQYQGQDGKINYPALIKDMKVVFSTHAAKLSESQKKGIESLISDTAVEGYGKTQDEGEKKYLGAQMNATQQKAMGVGMGPKSAPQRSFTGPGGKTMRVNQVFDESTGTYKDVGEPWEYKDPAAVVTVTTDAKKKAGGGELTEDALDVAANYFLRTGQMPALGMGSAGARITILNRAGELAKKAGVDPTQVPALTAEFKATQGALNKMERDYAGFAAFEQGMLKNMDYALSISKKYGNTPLPAANKIVNALRTQAGDPKIVEYANAIYAAAMEYEKIRTAGTSITSAELSVAAQKKAEELINTSQTHGQLVGAAKAMKTDARNIIGSRKGEIGKLKAALKDSPYAGKVNSGTATHRWNPQTQQLEPVGE